MWTLSPKKVNLAVSKTGIVSNFKNWKRKELSLKRQKKKKGEGKEQKQNESKTSILSWKNIYTRNKVALQLFYSAWPETNKTP
jgi:hypothetical protein